MASKRLMVTVVTLDLVLFFASLATTWKYTDYLKLSSVEFSFPSLFMTFHWITDKRNMTGDTSGAGTAYPWSPLLLPQFSVGLILCCSFCQITRLHIFSCVLWCLLWFLCRNDIQFIFTSIFSVRVHILFM